MLNRLNSWTYNFSRWAFSVFSRDLFNSVNDRFFLLKLYISILKIWNVSKRKKKSFVFFFYTKCHSREVFNDSFCVKRIPLPDCKMSEEMIKTSFILLSMSLYSLYCIFNIEFFFNIEYWENKKDVKRIKTSIPFRVDLFCINYLVEN